MGYIAIAGVHKTLIFWGAASSLVPVEILQHEHTVRMLDTSAVIVFLIIKVVSLECH